MTFRLLMSEHTILTIHYFESLFGSGSKSQTKTRAEWLFAQIDFWVPHFGNLWKDIMVEHTQLAAQAGQEVLDGKDPSDTIKRLFKNMERVVDHLSRYGYFRSTIEHHWTKHLNCTVDYLTALKAGGSTSNQYIGAKRDCIQFAVHLGSYLDRTPEKTPTITF